MRNHRSWTATLGLGLTLIAGVAFAGEPGGRNVADMKFANIPSLPTCLEGSVQTGDPADAPFILLVKTKAGCVVPWHWHTANEHLMIVSGAASVAMRDDGKPVVVKAGGFALLPAKHTHELRCVETCTFFLYSDGAFDIHYVDPGGKEISAKAALARVKQQPATASR